MNAKIITYIIKTIGSQMGMVSISDQPHLINVISFNTTIIQKNITVTQRILFIIL